MNNILRSIFSRRKKRGGHSLNEICFRNVKACLVSLSNFDVTLIQNVPA